MSHRSLQRLLHEVDVSINAHYVPSGEPATIDWRGPLDEDYVTYCTTLLYQVYNFDPADVRIRIYPRLTSRMKLWLRFIGIICADKLGLRGRNIDGYELGPDERSPSNFPTGMKSAHPGDDLTSAQFRAEQLKRICLMLAALSEEVLQLWHQMDGTSTYFSIPRTDNEALAVRRNVEAWERHVLGLVAYLEVTVREAWNKLEEPDPAATSDLGFPYSHALIVQQYAVGIDNVFPGLGTIKRPVLSFAHRGIKDHPRMKHNTPEQDGMVEMMAERGLNVLGGPLESASGGVPG